MRSTRNVILIRLENGEYGDESIGTYVGHQQLPCWFPTIAMLETNSNDSIYIRLSRRITKNDNQPTSWKSAVYSFFSFFGKMTIPRIQRNAFLRIHESYFNLVFNI